MIKENDFQEICQKFVNREISSNQTMLVEMLLEKEIISLENINFNQYDTPAMIDFICKEMDEHPEYKIQVREWLSENGFGINENICALDEDDLIGILDDIENIYSSEDYLTRKEIFEWWVISNHLADKLEREGEAILRTDYETWWGRTRTNQSIMLDSVIRDMMNPGNEKII